MRYWDSFEPVVQPWTLLVWEGLMAYPRLRYWRRTWTTSPSLQQVWRLDFDRMGILTFLGRRHAEWIEKKWEPLETVPLNEVFYADEHDLRRTIATDHWIRYVFDPDPQRATLAWGGKGHHLDPVNWTVS